MMAYTILYIHHYNSSYSILLSIHSIQNTIMYVLKLGAAVVDMGQCTAHDSCAVCVCTVRIL